MTAVLELTDVRKHYTVASGGLLSRRSKLLHAVDGATLAVDAGTSFALAGESGSGKSTLAKMILRLEAPSSGRIAFAGRDLANLSRSEGLAYRDGVQAVFQDASGSLNPRMRIGEIIAEPLDIRRSAGKNPLSRAEVRQRAADLIAQVGLPQRVAMNFPHELSGGQKQRVAIARAMVLEPRLVVLDEPVSALDVSIRAQILNLLSDFQDRLGVSYFLISHDLATLGHVSTRMAVMYLGRIVETGDTESLYDRPLHPYTRALFDAMPAADTRRVKKVPSVRGEIGSAMDLPRGCRFCPRCPAAMSVCREVDPPLVAVDARRSVACHLVPATEGSVP